MNLKLWRTIPGNIAMFLPVIVLLPVILLVLLTGVASAPAAPLEDGAGSGPGDGSGQGKNMGIALTLVSSSVEDGDINVPLDPVIQLDFNKNVVNLAVLEDNSTCFHLIDEEGVPVPINVVFPDDQVLRDFKRNIFICPIENLPADSQFELVVDSTLRAKNGTTIDNAHFITFKTGTKITGREDEALLKVGDNYIVYSNALEKTEFSFPQKQKVPKPTIAGESSAKQKMDLEKLTPILLLLIVVVFVGTSLFFILQKKRDGDR